MLVQTAQRQTVCGSSETTVDRRPLGHPLLLSQRGTDACAGGTEAVRCGSSKTTVSRRLLGRPRFRPGAGQR